MTQSPIVIFKSCYSLNKSILTLDLDDGGKEPRSIFSLYARYLDNGSKNPLEKAPLFITDDCLDGIIEASENAASLNIPLRFGVRLDICKSRFSSEEEVKSTSHKIIVFLKNRAAYTDICRLWTKAATLRVEGRKPQAILDEEILREQWTDNLLLCIPFYDSFIYNNNFTLKNCIPSFPSPTDYPIVPTFFRESHDLPFDEMLATDLLKSRDSLFPASEIVNTHTVYYEKKDHFKKYLTMRCIGAKTVLEKPELSHMCSDKFSLEAILQ